MSILFSYLGVWPAIGFFWFAYRALGLEIRPAVLVALGYCAVRVVWGLKSATPTKLDYTVAGYFAAGFLLTLFDRQLASLFLVERQLPFLFTAFTAMALLPVLAGAEPFTVAFARRRTPPAMWKSELFLSINRIMSLIWAGFFLGAALFALFLRPPFNIILPLLTIFGIGFPFNVKFPAWFTAREERRRARRTMAVVTAGTGEPDCHDDIIRPLRSLPDTVKQQQTAALDPVRSALVVFGSPRGKSGFTHLALTAFLDGMKKEGVEAEIVYLHEKKIKPCLGCFSCWTKTPGRCIQRDDMAEILAQGAAADLVVFAQPLYVFSVPGMVKNFLDRMLPGLLPFLEPGSHGLTSHPARQGHDFGRRHLILSVCGFPEKDHFGPLVDMFRCKARVKRIPIVGELLRPASESLKMLPDQNTRKETVMEALRRAGREVVRQGYVSGATEELISMPLFPVIENFHALANRFWQYRIDYQLEKAGGAAVGDLEDYLRDKPGMLFAGMAAVYDPAKAGDFEGTFQFHLTDRENDDYYLEVKDGRCRVGEGRAPEPDLIIKTPFAVWQAIAASEVSGSRAMLEGLYEIEGDGNMITRMQELFT